MQSTSSGEEPNDMGVAIDLLATYAGRAADLREWTVDAQINRDLNLRLQYLAGMWLNTYMGRAILDDILRHYRFPDQVFVGPEDRVLALRTSLQYAGRER